MQVQHRDDTFIVGLAVEAGFNELHTAVPAAWRQLFARRNELPRPDRGAYAEASLHLGTGRYRETLGVPLDHAPPAPPGMTVARIPWGDFLHHCHDGTMEDIANSFQAMYDFAADHGLHLGERKLDIGYTDAHTAVPHDLYIDIVQP